MHESTEHIRRALGALLNELLGGPAESGAFVLNRGDRGLLASLDRLSASQASERLDGRPSVAAHVDHLRYGFELLNRSARGEHPWADADYGASWQRQHVTDEQWRTLQSALAAEMRAWAAAVAAHQEWDDRSLTEALASIVHLAYHIGAIRQVARTAGGPPAND